MNLNSYPMKKTFFILFLIAALFIAFFAACTKDKHVSSVTLNRYAVTLAVGETATLIATVHPDDADNKNLFWKTNQGEIITVENGLVTAVAVGTAIVTVTAEEGDHTAHCTITVIHPGESEMVGVEGGTFIMGISDNENPAHTSQERPPHQVTLNSFKIAKYPVTQKQWNAIMEYNPSHFKGDNLPVENVSWNDVQTFISRLNAITGKNYRLPTEAEWEFAARGGNNSINFPYSGHGDLGLAAWYYGNSDKMSHPVGQKTPNELKLYDMSGNVWEWCQDWAAEYSEQAQIDPQGPATGTCRIARGGSYLSDYLKCRVSFRNGLTPNEFNNETGFRLALP